MVRQIIVYVVVIAFLIFVLLVSGAALFFTISGPVTTRPTISVITYTPTEKDKTQEKTAVPTVHSIEPSSTPKPAAIIPTPKIEATNQPTLLPHCGLSSPQKILYINTGKDAERFPSQAVRLIYINPSGNTASVITLPCDLWVTTPSLVNDYTISATRLCSLIQLVKNSPTKTSNEAGVADIISRVINDNFQLKTDRFIITSTDSLIKAVDKVKNIEINAPETMIISGIPLQKGVNKIDSSAIFSLFSFESQNTSPWESLNRQNEILLALYNKYKTAPIDLKEVMGETSTTTDFKDQELSALQCSINDLNPEKTYFSTIFEDMTTVNEDGTITMTDSGKIAEEIKNIFK
jgi:anionic cell wall polymer biosynthesis LytR-Cps2A-Psr (LCP) family protein